MPASNLDAIPTVMNFAARARPCRILDVGVGVGIYGMLLRTALDIMHERVAPEKWQLQIDGLEIFPDYRNPIWDFAYNRVHIGDIRSYQFPPDSFDLVLINDVLEHLTRKEAIACVTRLLVIAPTVILTTPVSHIQQGAWGGNVHETHRCVLRPGDFPNVVCTKVTGSTFCSVCCRNPQMAAVFRFEAGNVPVARPERLSYLAYRIRRKLRTLARQFNSGSSR